MRRGVVCLNSEGSKRQTTQTQGETIMTIEQQRTFGQAVGMESKVPTTAHRNDLVECSDGTLCEASEAFADSKGDYHSDAEARHESDVTIVTDVLNSVGEWADDYCTGNTDYADSYAHMIDEDSVRWHDNVEEWVEEHCDEYDLDSHIVESVVVWVFDELQGSFDCEPEYDSNEYSGYSGSGCCLASFDIGENEEQIDVSGHDELQALHDDNRLDDILDDVNCDVYVSRSHRREKNEETGNYERVGRETYMPYSHNEDHPTFEVYTNPGGQWHWVVSEDRMTELVDEALEALFGSDD